MEGRARRRNVGGESVARKIERDIARNVNRFGEGVVAEHRDRVCGRGGCRRRIERRLEVVVVLSVVAGDDARNHNFVFVFVIAVLDFFGRDARRCDIAYGAPDVFGFGDDGAR